jgi:hypothetical protein
MNWRGGLIRIWIVATTIWLMAWGGYVWQSCISNLEIMCRTSLLDDWMSKPEYFGSREYMHLAVTAFMPPIAVLVIGFAIGWAARGFQRRASN